MSKIGFPEMSMATLEVEVEGRTKVSGLKKED